MTPPSDVFELLTPPGEGGIAVFGLEGPGVRAALDAVVERRRSEPLSPGELVHGRLVAADGSMLDEVIVACLPGSEGRERFELNCHAGGAAAEAAARRLSELGLRRGELPPESGESTPNRAFRAALREVRTRRQAEALARARGQLEAELPRVRGLLDSPAGWEPARVALEMMLDESSRLDRLLTTHPAVLVGPANAGKSTLFNRLVGADRAITSPHPGTTRDTVEASVALRGLSVRLTDTAGLGEGQGALAERSRQLGREAFAKAGLVLLVLDSSAPPDPATVAGCRALMAETRSSITVSNKTDAGEGHALPPELIAGGGEVPTSALTGDGIPELLAAIERALLPAPPAGGAAVPQGACLSSLREAYACAEQACVENDPQAAREAAAILARLREQPV